MAKFVNMAYMLGLPTVQDLAGQFQIANHASSITYGTKKDRKSVE